MTTLELEPPPGPTPAAAGTGAGHRAIAGAAGVMLLGSLAAALSPGMARAVPLLLAGIGAVAVLGLTTPAAVAALRRHPSLLLVAGGVALAVLWMVTGVRTALNPWPSNYGQPEVPFLLLYGAPRYEVFGGLGEGWPWRLDGVALLPAVLALLCAAGGLVLLADAVRVQLGFAGEPRTQWRLITLPLDGGGRVAWRAIPGVCLIVAAAFLALGLTGRFGYHDPLSDAFVEVLIGAWAAALVASPVAVGAALQLDLDKAGRARERERQRFAAHLHDSVLQTLALVQRQAHDPAAVIRLARRQEHALRAWMAGEAELAGNTVATALREVVGDEEDESAATIELTVIGDHDLDPRGEQLVAAAREALRNAARHAPGAAVFVFGDITPERAELFIRDEGPGFDFDAVPVERRGLRDAVIGRMQAAGGSARVESTLGSGTEIALRLPYNGRSQ